MSKYKNIQELADAFKAGDLKGWILMVDNDNTYLSFNGPLPEGIEPDTEVAEAFDDSMGDKGSELWDGNKEVYILDQALTAAGIPNDRT